MYNTQKKFQQLHGWHLPMVAFLWKLFRYSYWNINENAKFETLGPYGL